MATRTASALTQLSKLEPSNKRHNQTVRRHVATVFVLAILVATAVAFAETERLKLQTMLAASDVLNHSNFHFPHANISAPGQAGVIDTTYGGGDDFNLEKAANRRMEVRLRLEF